MSWSKCHKNCVISGPLDAFCLVCESHLKSEDDLDAHFEKPIHKKNLESAQYFEKYKNDRIRKVKKGYYCEFCNSLFTTAAKVGLHVAESQHQYNRSSGLLRRVNNSVIAFDNILIDEKSWNGFVEDTCTICNTEFENENIHKTDQKHTLNLILKKIEFIDDKLVYRKIDESAYQCLTCNLVLASSAISTHVEQQDHINRLEVSREFGQEALEEGNTKDIVKTAKEQVTQSNPPKIDATIRTEIDVNKSNISNKDIKTTVKPESKEPKKTEGTSKKSEGTSKKSEVSKIPSRNDFKNPSELEKFICNVLGAKNYIIAQDNGKSMCILCDWCMDTAMVPAHLAGRHHLTILKMHKQRLDDMSNGDEKPKPKVDNQKVNNDKTDDDTNKILDSLTEFQKNDININFEMGVATCKKCSKSLNMEFKLIQSHIQEHKKTESTPSRPSLGQQVSSEANGKNSEPTKSFVYTNRVFTKRNEEGRSSRASSISSTRDDEQLEHFAKQNNLTYNNGKVYCPLCDSKLPTSLKNVKEHVQGAQHKKNKSTKKSSDSNNAVALPKSPALLKTPTQQFITSMIGLENDMVQDIIINEKYNINILSFLMITSENFTLKCQPCEVVLRPEDIDTHKITPNHLKAMTDTIIVTSLDNEFVREPRPDVFHCGYCAKVVHGWDELEDHLATNAHRGKRTSATWRMREHLAQVARERWQRAMGFMAFMNMFAGHNSSDDESWY